MQGNLQKEVEMSTPTKILDIGECVRQVAEKEITKDFVETIITSIAKQAFIEQIEKSTAETPVDKLYEQELKTDWISVKDRLPNPKDMSNISGLSLWADLKRLEELARDRFLDTLPSSPVHIRYWEQMQERTNIKEMVSAMPAIDPLHALGACYCGECKYRFTDDCSTHYESSQGQFQHITEDNGFCSYGERGTE